MARHTLRPHHCGYDLLRGEHRIGLVYREPDDAVWVLALDVAHRPDAAFKSYADIPAALREAACEQHPTLAALCAVLGVVIGGLPIPSTLNLPEAA